MKLDEAMNNEEIAKKLEDAHDMNEVINILKSEGVDTTEDELMGMLNSMTGELPEDALENVSGGLMGPIVLGGPIIFSVLLDLIRKGKINPGSSGSHHSGGGRKG